MDCNFIIATYIEYKLTNILKHKHPIGTFHYIVCWNVDMEANVMKELYGNRVILYKNENNILMLNIRSKNIKIINLNNIVDKIACEVE